MKLKTVAQYLGINVSRTGIATASFKLNGMALADIQEMYKAGQDLMLELSIPRKKRTLNQNAKLWALCGDISIKINGDRSGDRDIYCQILQMAGAKSDYFQGTPEAIRRLVEEYDIRTYTIVEKRKTSRAVTVVAKVFYGTSKMNTEEMSQVIEKALQYAVNVGIDPDYWRHELYGGNTKK